jgi:PAS domain S-box-containing protein
MARQQIRGGIPLWRRSPARYAFAALSALAATGVRYSIKPLVGDHAPYLPFLLAVVLAAWLWGRGPALVATILSALAENYFFLEPRYSLAVAKPTDAGSLIEFVIVCLLVIWLSSRFGGELDAREQRERALQRQTQLINLSHEAIVTLDANRAITSWNTGATEMYGWTSAEAMGKPIREVLQSRASLPMDAIKETLIRDGRWEGELIHSARDGTDVIVDSRQVIVRDESGVPAGFLEINRDITSGRRAEEALQSSGAKLNAALASTTDALFISDVNGRFVDFNDAFATFHRFANKDECLKTMARYPDILDVFFADGSPAPLDMWAVPRALRGETAKDSEYILRRRDTGESWVGAYSFGPIRDPDNRVVGAVVVGRDITDRKKAEEALRTSEQRFRQIFEKAPIGMAIANWDSMLEQCNPAFCRLVGRAEEELRGVWAGSLIPPEDVPATRSHMERLRAGEISFYEIDSRYSRPGSPLVCVRKFICLLPDQNAGPAHNLIMVSDITDRRRAEEALLERERTLRRFTEAAPVAIAMFDLEMRYLAASQRYRDDYQLGSRELVGESHYDVFPEIGEPWRDIHRRCLAGAVERNTGERFLRSDGTEQWLRWEAQPWRHTDGSVGGIVLFSENITLQRRAESTLRESEEQFRTLANAIPQLCWMANADGGIFWYNQRWYEYTGTTPEQMEAWGWQLVHNREVLPDVLQRWKRSVASCEPFEMVFPLRRADGAFCSFLTRAVPLHDLEGTVVRWFGTNTDITAQKSAEETLRSALELREQAETRIRELNASLERRVEERTAQLQQSNRELEAFSYSVAHDLRAPLRGIDGWSQALLEDYGDQLEGEARRHLDRVRAEAQRMGWLIDDLLQLSRITRSEMRLDQADLTALADSVAARLREQHPGRRIEIAVERGMTTRADVHLLEILLNGLLSNAVKFTTPREVARIAVGRNGDGASAAFHVSDNGVGFDMAHAGRLFEPFQRLHPRTEFPGTGIGLAIVARVARRHGGRVWAEASPGQGATFYFNLEQSNGESHHPAGGR